MRDRPQTRSDIARPSELDVDRDEALRLLAIVLETTVLL